MSLPPEKITELKQIIHNQLNQMDVQSRIRDVLSTSLLDESSGGPSQSAREFGEQELLQVLRDQGIVDDVMSQLQFSGSLRVQPRVDKAPQKPRPATHFTNKQEKVAGVPLKKDANSTCKFSVAKPSWSISKKALSLIYLWVTGTGSSTANIDPTRRYLYLQVLSGKAFLEHLQEPEALPGQTTSTFLLHVHFRGQRFRSRPVPCACEPDFREGFLLELHKEQRGDASRMLDATAMLSISDPVHLVLVKTDLSGDTSLVSSHLLQWRTVLSAPGARQTIAVELLGLGAESKVPAGVLEIKLELLPTPIQQLTDEVVTTQINLERSRTSERERLYLVYAKQWWKEFLQIRASHQNRLVKIFAQDENATNRPVCAFVKPLRAGRLLDTPRQAARFVSVIGYEQTPAVGGGQPREQWSSMHAFLCKNKGDCEDHAVLLCSLLLGFGLDAYVCVGTKPKGVPHTWLVTLGIDGLVTFWESLTGHRYIHQPINPDDPPIVDQPQPRYPYRTIGCVFDHQRFYANCQPSDNVDVCRFVFQDESLWKSMSIDAIQSVCGVGTQTTWPNLPPLVPSPFDAALLSNEIELTLRSLVSDHRKDLGLTCIWDSELSYLLTPALAAYELERSTGVVAGNEEFQQAIRRAVPDGHTFKGFPIQFVHRNARRAFTACLRSSVCDEIICCRGDHVKLAVRVRVFTYPESACAVWIMFACKYKSVL